MKGAVPAPLIYALNSDKLQAGDWILYKSPLAKETHPRIGQIQALHHGGELDQILCRRYLRTSDLTAAQLQQLDSLTAPPEIHTYSRGVDCEDRVVQEYADTISTSSYIGKCHVMHTSLREVGYPSPKYWKEPMPLFISHAVMLKKGPVYKAINLWRNGVVKPYRDHQMVRFIADNRKIYRDEMELKRLYNTVDDPWFKDHFETTHTYTTHISPIDLHRYWRLSHPLHPYTAAQTVERAMCAFKEEGVVEDQDIGGIRFLKLKEEDGAKASALVEQTVFKEEAEAWLIANYLPSFSSPPASVDQTDLWAAYARHLTKHNLKTSLSTVEFFNSVCPYVFGQSVRAEAIPSPSGGATSFVVAGIEPRTRPEDKLGDDETAAVDLVRWFCLNMELDASNRVCLDEPWDAYCSWHPSDPSSTRRAIDPTKFAQYLSAIRPEIPEIVTLSHGVQTMYGVRLRNRWEPVDLERAIGRDVGAARRPKDWVAQGARLPRNEVEVAGGKSGGELRRKTDEEVPGVESPDPKRRRKDSGFHEMATEVPGKPSTFAAAPRPPPSSSSTRSAVVSPAPLHPTSTAQHVPFRPPPQTPNPFASTGTDMTRSTSLPTRLAAAPSPSYARPAMPASTVPPEQTKQCYNASSSSAPPPPRHALHPPPIPIPPPQLPPPSAVQLLARSSAAPTSPRTPAEAYLWTSKGSPLQKMKLGEFLQMMAEADGGRAEGYVAAFLLLKDAIIEPDVMLELGTAGLERNGVKSGCAAKIIMALRGELTRA